MDVEEKIHYLSILVEWNLFSAVRAIKERNIENKDEAIEKAMDKFKNDLPEYLSDIPNLDNKILRILAKTQKSHDEIRKIREKSEGEER